MPGLFALELVKHDLDFVAQAEIPELSMIIVGIGQGGEVSSHWMCFLEGDYGLPNEQLRALIMQRLKVFVESQDAWPNYNVNR